MSLSLTLRRLALSLTVLLGAVMPFDSYARTDLSVLFPEKEFVELAQKLAPKVNLFAEVWKSDPQAQFFGGTTRDYLYWIRRQFEGVQSREEALKVKERLLSTPMIAIREFIQSESDVDIVTSSPVDPGLASEYGIAKVDRISDSRFRIDTIEGFTEVNQGFIPIEKIRLSKAGFVQYPALGNGVSEIYRDAPSVSFPDPELFEKTHYASKKINHPILLALRYLRLMAMHSGASARFEPEVENRIKKIVGDSVREKQLLPYFEQPKFVQFFNDTIQKSFRLHGDPDGAKSLMEKFGIGELISAYEGSGAKPYNGYLFKLKHDESAIRENFKKYGIDPEKGFFQDPKKYFPDMQLYHGTEREAFRLILTQGVLPSSGGSGGRGLYGVGLPDRGFAENWKGANKENLIAFPIDPQARIVDVNEEGVARQVLLKHFDGNEDKFSKAFGVDILRYEYDATAFVVKNRDSIGNGKGVYREVVTLSSAFQKVGEVKNREEYFRFMRDVKDEMFTAREVRLLVESMESLHAKLPLLTWVQEEINQGSFQHGHADYFADKIRLLPPEEQSRFLTGLITNLSSESPIDLVLRMIGKSGVQMGSAELDLLARHSFQLSGIVAEYPEFKSIPFLPEELAKKAMDRPENVHTFLLAKARKLATASPITGPRPIDPDEILRECLLRLDYNSPEGMKVISEALGTGSPRVHLELIRLLPQAQPPVSQKTADKIYSMLLKNFQTQGFVGGTNAIQTLPMIVHSLAFKNLGLTLSEEGSPYFSKPARKLFEWLYDQEPFKNNQYVMEDVKEFLSSGPLGKYYKNNPDRLQYRDGKKPPGTKSLKDCVVDRLTRFRNDPNFMIMVVPGVVGLGFGVIAQVPSIVRAFKDDGKKTAPSSDSQADSDLVRDLLKRLENEPSIARRSLMLREFFISYPEEAAKLSLKKRKELLSYGDQDIRNRYLNQ